MKKVLAKLSRNELEQLELLHSRISTYRALLQNKFVSNSERVVISKELSSFEQELDSLVESLIKKYRIPKSISNIMQISYNDSEIYLEMNN